MSKYTGRLNYNKNSLHCSLDKILWQEEFMREPCLCVPNACNCSSCLPDQGSVVLANAIKIHQLWNPVEKDNITYMHTWDWLPGQTNICLQALVNDDLSLVCREQVKDMQRYLQDLPNADDHTTMGCIVRRANICSLCIIFLQGVINGDLHCFKPSLTASLSFAFSLFFFFLTIILGFWEELVGLQWIRGAVSSNLSLSLLITTTIRILKKEC